MARNARHDGTHLEDDDEAMLHFAHNDAGYLDWLTRHTDGFVINTYATPSPGYLKLHHATCSSISRLQRGQGPLLTATTARSAADGMSWRSTPAALVDQQIPARSACDLREPCSRHDRVLETALARASSRFSERG